MKRKTKTMAEAPGNEAEQVEAPSRSAQRRAIFKNLKTGGFLGYDEADGYYLLLSNGDKSNYGKLFLSQIEGFSEIAVAASYHADNPTSLIKISANQARLRAFKAGIISKAEYEASIIK